MFLNPSKLIFKSNRRVLQIYEAQTGGSSNRRIYFWNNLKVEDYHRSPEEPLTLGPVLTWRRSVYKSYFEIKKCSNCFIQSAIEWFLNNPQLFAVLKSNWWYKSPNRKQSIRWIFWLSRVWKKANSICHSPSVKYGILPIIIKIPSIFSKWKYWMKVLYKLIINAKILIINNICKLYRLIRETHDCLMYEIVSIYPIL